MSSLSVNLLVILVAIGLVSGSKILGVFPAPGYSQFILAESLMQELAKRGHDVTVISAYEPKNKTKNYKTILVDKEIDMDLFALEDINLFSKIMSTYELGYFITNTTLRNPEVKKLLKSGENFDVVIVEKFFTEALEAFASHFRAPLVLFSSIGASEWNNGAMGNPGLPSINTISWLPYTRHMSFAQRIVNFIASVFDFSYKHLIAYPTHQQFLNDHLENPPDLKTVIYNASLMLLNSHVVTAENMPLTHDMVEIGGFHIKETPLDASLKRILDNAENGVIFFSLGSNLNSANLPKPTLEAILRVFSKLKQTVLWKFETDLNGKPGNVHIAKWLPQSDILAHPNVQLFITHGGLLSVTEAVFYGVPMVGIPVFGDQKMNMARVTRNGFGRTLRLREINEETFFGAINETISDPKYQRSARLRANIMRDGVVRPLQLAMHWIEHVIRYKGLNFKSPALDLAWYQLYMLDIVLFFTLSPFIVIFVLRKLITLYFCEGENKRQNGNSAPQGKKKKKLKKQ